MALRSRAAEQKERRAQCVPLQAADLAVQQELWVCAGMAAGLSVSLPCPRLSAGELHSRRVSEQMRFLPATLLFFPWRDHLKAQTVCSRARSSCFVCMSSKRNFRSHCNAVHRSLLESIALISSHSTTKKTRKNENKGEPACGFCASLSVMRKCSAVRTVASEGCDSMLQ